MFARTLPRSEPPTVAQHYHVRLYHGSQRIPPTDAVFADRVAAVQYRDSWNTRLEGYMGVKTYRLRIIRCTPLHLPLPENGSPPVSRR
jgi:hypothetical protein